MTGRREAALLLAITALGAGLRLWDLGGRSLWVDEIVAWTAMQRPSLPAVLGWVAIDQMPLFYVLEWVLRGAGGSEAGIRALSAGCGILLVPALHLLVRRLAGPTAGLWAALLAAVSPFLVWYSQDATAYALLLLASTVAAWAAHRAVERARLGDWLLLSGAAAGTAYAHYSGLLVVAALYAWALGVAAARRDGLRALGAATSGVVALALVAPWTPWIRAYLRYAPPLGAKASAAGLPLVDQPPRLLVGLGLLPLVLPLAVLALAALRGRRSEAILLGAWFGVPLAAVVAAGRLGSLGLPPRYFSALVPPLVAAAGIGAAGIADRLPRLARVPAPAWAAALAVVASVPQLVAWQAEPKDDWRGAAAAIHRRAEPGSVVVVLGYGTVWARPDIAYYLDREGAALPVVDLAAPVDPRALPELEGAHPVFAVFNTADGPSDLRLDGRSATGDFTAMPPPAAGVEVVRETGVAVATAPDVETLLAWASRVPNASAWLAATTQR